MFVRNKRVKNGIYYYLVKAYRKDGRPKQRVVKYLGKLKPSQSEIDKLIEQAKNEEIAKNFGGGIL